MQQEAPGADLMYENPHGEWVLVIEVNDFGHDQPVSAQEIRKDCEWRRCVLIRSTRTMLTKWTMRSDVGGAQCRQPGCLQWSDRCRGREGGGRDRILHWRVRRPPEAPDRSQEGERATLLQPQSKRVWVGLMFACLRRVGLQKNNSLPSMPGLSSGKYFVAASRIPQQCPQLVEVPLPFSSPWFNFYEDKKAQREGPKRRGGFSRLRCSTEAFLSDTLREGMRPSNQATKRPVEATTGFFERTGIF